MDALILCSKEERYRHLAEMIKNTLKKCGVVAEIYDIFNRKTAELTEYLYENSAKIIISIDLAGFQLRTLQETFLYNILPAKQVHFLTQESQLNILCGQECALNLYMAIPKKEYKNAVLRREENIPHVIFHGCYEKENGIITPSAVNQKIVEDVIMLFVREL